ncbi:MAG TPA: hypothetical protein PKK26_16085, partial [Candidatus Wallbacteria bacterium]|nr:hypothetical protein [Candidatus Wallbacteria bacterium]
MKKIFLALMLGVSFSIQLPEMAFSQDTYESKVIKSDANAPGADTSEVSHPDAVSQPSNVRAKILEIAELNKKIFFSEQMIGLKMSNEAQDVEGTLNSLYKKREALCDDVKKTCSSGDPAKEIRAIKSEILNVKLYDAAGFDSLVEKLKTIKLQPQGSDSNSVSLGGNAKDSIMELESYVKLESARLEDPITFNDELKKFASKPQENAVDSGASDAGASSGGGIDPQYEAIAVFNPAEMYPAGNERDIAIDSPAEIKFDGDKIKKQDRKIDIVVKSVDVRQKYTVKPGGSDAGKMDVKWNPEKNSLSISHNAPLERGAMYSATVTFEHKIPTVNNPAPNGQNGGSASSSTGGAASSGSVSSAVAGASSGLVRNKSVNGGIFKTVDIDFSENKIKYKLDWNFETIGYTVESVALPDGATNEAKLKDGTGEVALKDKRETDEAKLKKGGSTGETALKKAPPAFQLYDDAKSLPAIILRMPEGPDVRRKSEIFVVFSTDMSPASVKHDT